ncbi:Rrf2 family transcriptional regulator [Bacillus sp. B1-b2]|uniref:Rrf2 family transcriptional regulator n=1 Tax=Bacillus sp. B1-b2 TaxID=2653201 RepID=UPI0012618FEA|nr:Rrf2 family transcriptional regulator [Bacillus sp. B1-b2]KAB7668838.1 Rrf2 family transcriptional regulator [Bacillus sp. B1-b2]
MVNSKFSVSIHILSLIASNPSEPFSSESIAESVNTNPVVIRRICGLLKKKGIISSRAGISGASLLISPSQLSLLDIYLAVKSNHNLFALHEHPNPNCPIGSKIQDVLVKNFSHIQEGLEKDLATITLSDVIEDMHILPMVNEKLAK